MKAGTIRWSAVDEPLLCLGELARADRWSSAQAATMLGPACWPSGKPDAFAPYGMGGDVGRERSVGAVPALSAARR